MADTYDGFVTALRRTMDSWLKTEGATHPWADHLGHLPELIHLICRLSVAGALSATHKGRLAPVLAYIISPVDLLPEAITGPAGFTDDTVLAAGVIDSIARDAGVDIIRKHWTGGSDIMEVTAGIVRDAEAMVGRDIWDKLKELAGISE